MRCAVLCCAALPRATLCCAGADREVQRILMELLNQMDGFDQTVNVKVRMNLYHYAVTCCRTVSC
jgi:hypothetical protein